ncbi:MAG: hypothetical protein V9F00_12540 [Nocardioides sp.]
MPADHQQRWLASIGGGHVDELALDWDAGWRLVDQWVAIGWLSELDAAAFAPIDAALSSMSGGEHAELWSPEAVRRAPEWAHVRELANAALFNL